MSVQPSRVLSQCPLCQTNYREERIRLVGGQGTTRLFHCTCEACGHSMLAVILEASGFISSVGVLTDLKAQDALYFQSVVPLSSDECIHFHQLLESESVSICQELMVRA